MGETELTRSSIKFDGRILNRGFWLYVIDIHSADDRYLYVGRTGDSSSANATSPFVRIGQHLDLRPNAKGNALLRNLRSVGLDPCLCTMEMIAVGPIFPEERDFSAHRLVRDRVAALECGLAHALRESGYKVLGQHTTSCEPDRKLLAEALSLINARLAESRAEKSTLTDAGIS